MASKRVILAVVVTLSFFACSEDSGLDVDSIATDLEPCDDFYELACRGWIEKHPLRGDSARIARFSEPFNAAAEKLQRATASASPEAILYQRACNGAATTTSGRAEVRASAPMIDRADPLGSLARKIATQRSFGSGTFFRFGVEIDPGDTTRHMLYAWPGGLELRDRSYYVDAEQQHVRDAYRMHIARLSQLVLGTALEADAVLSVELALATAMPEDLETLPPEELYHPLSLDEVNALVPSFKWSEFLHEAGYDGADRLDVASISYFQALETLLSSTPTEDLEAYMTWQFVQDAASALDDEVLRADFDFWNMFVGRSQPLPRDWVCFLDTLDHFPNAVARQFLREFDDIAIGDTNVIAEDIRRAFGARLDGADWLDDATRGEGRAKLEAVQFHLGHPASWTDEQVVLDESGSFFAIQTAFVRQRLEEARMRLDQPVDRVSWDPNIDDNAYYGPQLNTVTVGALLLSAPFVVAGVPRARNYGAIGAVLGHELTHGFDDSGRHFDRGGNVRMWWSPDSAQRFESRASCLVDAYDAYTLPSGEHIDGKLTLGENIADLGGLTTAYHALFDGEDPGGGGDGYSAEQVFFLSYAQVWCSSEKPELTSARLLTDPHSPEKARVDETLAHMPEFHEAFECRSGDKMYRQYPCRVW